MDIRYAVRVFAFKDNKVACIKYKNINKDYFDIPGGKIEDGETEIQTCIREFKEETGMDINDLKCIGNVEIIYPGKNKKFVMKKDKARSNYYNYYTTKKWGQLKNFDLTINSDFGIEEVADIIVALYKKGEHKNK